MKILIINSFYYPNMVGGTEQVVKKLAEGLTNIGHDVMVFTCDGGNRSYTDDINSIKVTRCKTKYSSSIFKDISGIKKLTYKITELRNYKIMKHLKLVLKNFKPDIVHTNNIYFISLKPLSIVRQQLLN